MQPQSPYATQHASKSSASLHSQAHTHHSSGRARSPHVQAHPMPRLPLSNTGTSPAPSSLSSLHMVDRPPQGVPTPIAISSGSSRHGSGAPSSHFSADTYGYPRARAVSSHVSSHRGGRSGYEASEDGQSLLYYAVDKAGHTPFERERFLAEDSRSYSSSSSSTGSPTLARPHGIVPNRKGPPPNLAIPSRPMSVTPSMSISQIDTTSYGSSHPSDLSTSRYDYHHSPPSPTRIRARTQSLAPAPQICNIINVPPGHYTVVKQNKNGDMSMRVAPVHPFLPPYAQPGMQTPLPPVIPPSPSLEEKKKKWYKRS
ncbi:hypothetical protein DL96DRAFT_1716348 [Flagelloscypha sp. PMI_526]|nr:hypothetical protein DL96DRAFT_1716348 [Flagelloscypha sp. PMI_526]